MLRDTPLHIGQSLAYNVGINNLRFLMHHALVHLYVSLTYAHVTYDMENNNVLTIMRTTAYIVYRYRERKFVLFSLIVKSGLYSIHIPRQEC